MNILAVDDERSAQLLLKGLLAKLGHRVEVATDGAQGWQMIEDADPPFDLIVTDWNMPRMTGLDLCKRIRGRKADRYTYVILVTVRDDLDSFGQGMAAGADDFITKPFDVGLMASRVRVAERIMSLSREVSSLRAEVVSQCIYCKAVRTGKDRWVALEDYLATRPDLELTDKVCPSCYRVHLAPELEKL